jgi:hypothetical protein
MPDVNEGPQRGPFAYPCPTKRAGKNVRIYTGGNRDEPGSQNAERSKSDDVCCGSRALMVRDIRPLPLRAAAVLLTMRDRACACGPIRNRNAASSW